MITRIYALIRVPRFITREARHATWTELFYDLAFVVAVSTLGHELSHDLTPWGVAEFAVLFSLLWLSWIGHTFYANRFDTDDLIHRVVTLFHMGAICGVAVFASDWLRGDFMGFLVAYVLLRLLIIFNYASAAIFEPQARPLALRYITGFSIGIALIILAAFVPHSMSRLGVVILSLLVDMLTPVLVRVVERRTPLDVDHIPERFGLFTILVLGETLVASVRTVQDADLDIDVLRGLIIGLVIAFSIWWMYFVNLNNGALRRMAASTYVWIYAHLPLMMSLILIAIGLESSIGPYALTNREGIFLLYAGWTLALIFLGLIDGVNALERPRIPLLRYINIAVKFGIAFALEMWFFLHNTPVTLRTITILSVIVVLIDIYCNALPEEED